MQRKKVLCKLVTKLIYWAICKFSWHVLVGMCHAEPQNEQGR